MAESILPANYWANWVKNNPEKAAANRAEHYARVVKKHGVNVSMEEYYARIADEAARDRAPKRISESDLLIRCAEWKALRATVLAKHGKKCMSCGSRKNIQVDHIKPKSKYPELALEFSNLQVLCWDCNKRKSARHSSDYRKQPILI